MAEELKPIRYTIVKEYELADLVKEVNLKIQAGWVPLGNVFVLGKEGLYPKNYYQAMVQYEEFNEFKPA